MSGPDDVDPAADPADDLAANLARAEGEIARLRRLVGPHEHDYDDLKAEIVAAEQAVRTAEAANGELRAEITELRVDLRRARQDQYHLWKLVARPQRLLRALRQSAE